MKGIRWRPAWSAVINLALSHVETGNKTSSFNSDTPFYGKMLRDWAKFQSKKEPAVYPYPLCVATWIASSVT